MDVILAEDPSKKRDSAQVEDGDDEEKSKKVRVLPVQAAERHRSPTRRLVQVVREPHRNHHHHPREASSSANTAKPSERPTDSSSTASNAQEAPAVAPRSSTVGDSTSTATAGEGVSFATPKIWDLESALLYMVQVDGEEKEYLSEKDEAKSPWLTFRVGHAGDASTIAQLYRNNVASNENPEVEIVAKPTTTTASETSTTNSNNNDPSSEDDARSSMLELWLADGLGDEDTPPAFHALLGHVHQNNKEENETTTVSSSSLAAVALLTLDWDDGERVLRVQWMYIDPTTLQNTSIAQTLEQRTWLRISTLAQMTACQVVAVDKKLTMTLGSSEEKSSTKDRPSPSAE